MTPLERSPGGGERSKARCSGSTCTTSASGCVPEHTLREITAGGVRGSDVYGDAFEIAVRRRRADDAAAEPTTRCSTSWSTTPGDVEGVYAIGDCVAPRVIADAILDGHRLAREIDTADPATPLPWQRERTALA